MIRTFCAALFVAACFVAPAAAQQPAQRQVDSLAAQVRLLRARIDSLLAALRKGDAAAGDDLAAIRAAAAAAAGRDTMRADTAPARFVGRERNQNQLNPEISVTSDLRGAVMEGAQRDNFELHEVEISFQAALDPFSHTKIFAAVHDGALEIEEGYFYYTGLPGRLRLDLGAFRQQFGELNRWHLHAVPEAGFPLALTTYFGEDGLAGTGLSLYRAFGGLGTHEVIAQVTRSASDDELFGGGGRPTYLARLLNFWQLGRATYMQVGGSALYGTNPDSALRTRVGGVDVRFTWRPPARALYREWTVRAELLAVRKDVGGSGPTRLGGYVGTTYKLNQRFIAGLRYDYVESPETGAITRQVIPSLTFWQSEWVFLRAQYQWQRVPAAATTHQVTLQAVWSIGPHKHETY